jgi:outer membrane protein insertion porin family
VSDSVQEFSRSFRWSAGAGFVMPTVFGRFEANYVVVLSHQENDRLRRGIQLGFVASSLM